MLQGDESPSNSIVVHCSEDSNSVEEHVLSVEDIKTDDDRALNSSPVTKSPVIQEVSQWLINMKRHSSLRYKSFCTIFKMYLLLKSVKRSNNQFLKLWAI